MWRAVELKERQPVVGAHGVECDGGGEVSENRSSTMAAIDRAGEQFCRQYSGRHSNMLFNSFPLTCIAYFPGDQVGCLLTTELSY